MKRNKSRRFFPSILILIPVIAAITTLYYIFGPVLMYQIANEGNNRLTTTGWETALSEMNEALPTYGPKYAYYKLAEGQNLAWAAQHFSVSLVTLQKLNPGTSLWGTTIIVPPLQHSLVPVKSGQLNSNGASVSVANGIIYVSNPYKNNEIYMNMPMLYQLLSKYGAITEVKPTVYLISKPIYIDDNIRLDITSPDVSRLLLLSNPNFDITTLTFDNAEGLFDGISVSSYDTITKQPDTNIYDGRSFIRAYGSARMDMLNTHVSYLGMNLKTVNNPKAKVTVPILKQGGIYGVSWRIASGTYGSNIVTGWVQNSSFEHNDIGSFTFGASGMMWDDNLFDQNKIYGLDPHDDSNNATIEYNRFINNGKHGFIVSKRCDYNTIIDNYSIDNSLHGFMLHDNSDYNIIKNNIAVGNYDNFVVYDSNFNLISGNKAYNPRGSQVRINQGSLQNYVSNNSFFGGKTGVYLYGGANGASVTNNLFDNVSYELKTKEATRVLFTGNQSTNVGYDIRKNDLVVFGVNKINKKPDISLKPVNVISSDLQKHIPLTSIPISSL